MKETKDTFIEEVIKCLKEEDVDVPFLIAPLIQTIDSDAFGGFLNDLSVYTDYHIEYSKDPSGWFNGCILIHLNRNSIGSMRFIGEVPKYIYQIEF